MMGGLTKEIYLFINQDPTFLRELVHIILEEHVPKHLAAELLHDEGLDQVS